MIKGKTKRLQAGIESVEDVVIRKTTRRLLAAMSYNKTAVYVMCATVIVGIIAALLKGTFLSVRSHDAARRRRTQTPHADNSAPGHRSCRRARRMLQEECYRKNVTECVETVLTRTL